MRARSILLGCLTLTLASCGGGRDRATDAETASSSNVPPHAGNIPEMKFALIPPGSFEMGSDASFDMQPVHTVTIRRAFQIQTTEVTQAQWRAVMGSNPSQFPGDDRPVEQVSWNDAQEFIRRLNRIDPGRGYRLPTEAEWEYACRAGSGDRGDDLDDIAWWHRNSENQTHPVATKRANNWGLHDMIGNVWEYTSDWKGPYVSGPISDPAGPEKGYYKVSRDGSWFDVGRAANAAFRASPDPTDRGNSQGFRLARAARE